MRQLWQRYLSLNSNRLQAFLCILWNLWHKNNDVSWQWRPGLGGRVTALVTLVTANVVIGVKQLKYFSPYYFYAAFWE